LSLIAGFQYRLRRVGKSIPPVVAISYVNLLVP